MSEASETYGEKAVGISLDSYGDAAVDDVRRLFALVIDIMHDMRARSPGERARLCSIAITEAQTAQMWAVKAITWQD